MSNGLAIMPSLRRAARAAILPVLGLGLMVGAGYHEQVLARAPRVIPASVAVAIGPRAGDHIYGSRGPWVLAMLAPSCPYCERWQHDVQPSLVRAAEAGKLRLIVRMETPALCGASVMRDASCSAGPAAADVRRYGLMGYPSFAVGEQLFTGGRSAATLERAAADGVTVSG